MQTKILTEEGETISMKKFVNLMLGVTVAFGAATIVFAQNEKRNSMDENKKMGKNEKEERDQAIEENVRVVLDIFNAIERRDERRFLDLIHPDFVIHWPPSLPYGGVNPISRNQKRESPTWSETWAPLQPTEAERKMDPRVVAASGKEVVVLYRQRGVTQSGDRFDGEVLGIYQVVGGKLARAQMFYFDTAALVSFLAKVGSRVKEP
jgi:ketosteroid isomerase-like protein